MTAVERFHALLQRNEELQKTYQAPALLADIVRSVRGGGQIFMITCSDSRCDPTQIFGLKRGEVSVIRNAGGRASDAIRTIEVMATIAPPGLITVMHHTDCGGLFTTDDEIRAKWIERSPDQAATLKDKDFGTFQDIGLEESVRRDIQEIQEWPLLPKDTPVLGYIFEVETGRVRQVS